MWDAKDGSDLPLRLVEMVREKVSKCYIKAWAVFGEKTPVICDVEFGLQGLCAGKAYYHANKIRINSEFLLREHEDMLNDTVPHEIAHLVAYRVFSRRIKPHGAEWRLVMEQVFGVSDVRRTHNYAITRIAGRYRAANPHLRKER